MRLRTFLQSLPLPVIGLDRQRHVVLWNAAAERLLGWTADEVLGEPDPSVPAEVALELKTIVSAAFRGEEAVQRETARVTRAGELLDVEITTTLLPATTREPAIALTLLHDITDHRAAADRLAAREGELQLVLDQLPAIVSTFDRDGVLTSAAGAGLRAIEAEGYTLVTRNLVDIAGGPETAPVRSFFAALRGEASTNEFQWKGRYYQNRMQPLRDRGGQVIGAINLGFDITDSRQMELALRESREQLRGLSAAMNRMQEDERRRIAREMHDELGQLLTALHLDLGMMRRDVRCNSTEALEERVGSMIELVDLTIKTVRRVATELRPAVLDDFGLRAAVENEVATFTERTGIDVRLSIRRDELIDADAATAIYRIVQEALTNVARHAGATCVEVRIEAGGGRVEAELRDNGRGITEVEINRSSTLGLLGLRERAYALGGEAVIEPIPGDGTRIFVSFPQ